MIDFLVEYSANKILMIICEIVRDHDIQVFISGIFEKLDILFENATIDGHLK